MIFKKMSEMSAEDMVALWNKGFEGYFLNSTLNLDKFLARAVNEGLSLENSLVVCENRDPIGFVMNGFRVIEGKRVAWNGGTGIATEHRGRGIGKKLMERNLQLYREQGVDIALLEALIQNKAAIKLYQSVGYVITEQLISLQHTEALDASLLLPNSSSEYVTRRGLALEVKGLSFYRHLSAWQTQWASMKDGECIIVSDHEDEVVGYALYKRIFGDDGNLSTIALHQCESIPGRTDSEDILKAALSEVYAPFSFTCKRITMNIRDSNKGLIGLLERLGFTKFVEQVYMIRHL
ncbi:GNAT family N-acetyltransferase [Paenibacillus frigoriresistens]|uniref:GNAT family N-acetyltransferase n=1 Tax=Paenibacillus alginolyticus TaxID=59839 RepID=UPI0015678CB3|nr:GNAT family N-acetyltransferase [Paenibacillus frigoriresistens]NRF93034.1 GNAT family N-acetyltransferase [Paenibacillus frigoriresistens]